MLSRNIRDAFKSVIRNFSLSMASISCITITLIVVSISMIVSYNVENFTRLIKQDVTVVAFLDKDVEQEDINNIEMRLRSIVNVDSYEFRSKDKTKELMQQSSEVFNKIMSEWDSDENPLQDSFLIKVLEVENIKSTVNEIKGIEHVSIVKYGEGMIEKMLSIFDIVKKGTIGLVALLIFVTAFLVANTIKITIFARKREIEIMRLVGASNITIKLPHIIEGLFLGIIGSIIPILFTIYGYYVLYTDFDGKLFSPFLRLVPPEPFIYIISLVLIVIGMIVGMWGSSRAVRRHLKI
jgi:cell division transport system permease protein